MKIVAGRVQQPDEAAAEEFNNPVIKWKDSAPGKPLPEYKSEVEGVSDEEFTRATKQFLDDQVAQGWEIVREEAEEALRKNPHDEHAKESLLKYNHYKKHPKGLVLMKPGRKMTLSTRKIGVFKHTDKGWLLKLSQHLNCHEGDIAEARMKGGVTKEVVLTEDFGGGFFRVRDL